MRPSERRSWPDEGTARPSFLASVNLRGWLWSAAIHGALVGAMVWGGPTVPRQDMQDVFQWEVQLTTGTMASASSMEAEEASVRSDTFENASSADRPTKPTRKSAVVTARREVAPALTRDGEPVVSGEHNGMPIEAVAVATATEESVGAADSRSASTDSITDMSRDETTMEVERDESTASVQEPSGSALSGRETSRRDRGEPTADTGHPAQSVTAEQATARSDYGWVGLALRARVEERKRYSVDARLNEWEGRAVVAADIVADGRIIESRVVESSGNPRLDEDARALVAGVSPLKLAQALEADRLTVKIPIVFGLR